MLTLEQALKIKPGKKLAFKPTRVGESSIRLYEKTGFRIGDECTVLEAIPISQDNIYFKVRSGRTKRVDEYNYAFFKNGNS